MRILDLYDDPSATVLRQHLDRTGGGFPTKVASMQVGEAEKLAGLPDRLFALVATYNGEKIRKYAMHDPEHVATGILYFLECGGQLPEDIRTKVAMNLIEACGWYETPPPVALTKVALLGRVVNTGLGALAVPDAARRLKRQALTDDEELRAAQLSGMKVAKGRSANTPEEAWNAIDKFIRGEESLEDRFDDFGSPYANMFKGDAKTANLSGTEAGSHGGLSNDPRPTTPAKRFAVAAKVSHDVGEISYLEPGATVADARHFALPHRGLYPIDTPEQVKRASSYFAEHGRDFELDDRRLYAQSVATRAEQLGLPVDAAISKFAGNTYGPHIVPELKGRILALEGTGKEASYEVLLEHLDATPPIVMYDMLKIADEDSGLDQGYGRPVTGFKDPLSAVFGAPEKPIYTWVGRGHYVTEEQLRSYSKLVPEPLDKVMGSDWCSKFVEDPVKEFDKLPDAKKIIVARLASGEAFRFM